jgi:hypothetical protein
MAPDDSPVLKLRAEDADDLAVLSACLQDALVAVRDLAYLAEEERFIFVANRFRWETGMRPLLGEEPHQRILCVVTFGAVGSVAYRGFRRTDEDRILCLLAIRGESPPPLPSPPRPRTRSGDPRAAPGRESSARGHAPETEPAGFSPRASASLRNARADGRSSGGRPMLDTGADVRGEGRGSILLEFAGDGAIRLEVARIECRAKDLGEPWPTRWRPRHDEEAAK